MTLRDMSAAELRAALGGAESEPLPLPEGPPPVAKLEPEMLPDTIRSYIMDVADRQQSPPDFVAVAALCGLSALLGRKVLMRPKRYDDWTVTPNLWGAIIGRPSAMKSPSMKEALKPLYIIEADAREAYEQAKSEYAAEERMLEIEKKDIEARAKKLAKEGRRNDALALLTETAKPPPSRARVIVNDATVEKLGELLNQNPNGLLLARDELSGWLAKLAQDDHQADRAFYLECFDGNGRFTYDRIGRGTIDIENCVLSLVGGIQPSKIAPLVRGAIRGTTDDGLVQRLQLAVWPDDQGGWQWKDRTPDAQAKDRYYQAFYRVHGLQFDTVDGEPPCWRFDEDAQAMFIEWMEEIQSAARAKDIHPALESHLLKMPKTVAALALLFEVLDGGCGNVGAVAAARALEWADYLHSHAERLYNVAIHGDVEGARLIHDRRGKLPNPFTVRDVLRKGWAGLDNLDAVRSAIDVLLDYQHIIATEILPSTNGGRPATLYHWTASVEVK